MGSCCIACSARLSSLDYSFDISLAPGKDQHGLAQLNLITFLQLIGLVLVDRLAVHLRAVCAAFIAQGVIAVAHTDDRGVQARDGQIFEEDVAFAAASNAQ